MPDDAPTHLHDPAAPPTPAPPAGSTADGDPPPPPDAAPASPPGYDLLAEAGRGGMGVVHRALDRELGREVAVKLLHGRYAPGSAAARRFTDEARITGQLQHPGIPPVYRVGQLADGRPFLAMKLIKGDTLDDLLRQAAPVDRLGVFERVCAAVGYAHSRGVIHRDLKPQNVMVGAFGEVQVMDWGLAKVLAVSREAKPSEDDPEATADAGTAIRSHRDSDTPFTQYGSALGTPAFMPPEQAAGELDKVDRRSDVFGLGAVLCVLLTGRPPLDGRDAEAVRLNAVRGDTAAALARLDACGADPAAVALCKRCLSFDPAARPADAGAVADAVAGLRRAADDRARRAEVDRGRAEVRAAAEVKRRRATLWAAGWVVAALLLGVAGTAFGLWRADAARRAAEAAERAEAGERQKADAARQDADARRAEAEAARGQAESKEAEAEAVVAFFDEAVLAAPRPKGQDKGQGSEVTVRAALEASLPKLDAGFADRPLVEARLRFALAKTFGRLGEYRKATGLWERARELYARHRGPDDPETLKVTTNLAVNYANLGRHADALQLREEALAARRRTLPADHRDLLSSVANLSGSYYRLGRHADALRLREEAVAGCRRAVSPDDPLALFCLSVLADSYATAGRHADALKLREEALVSHKRALPPNHPDTLRAMSGLAQSYAALGRHADALSLQQDTLAGRRRVLPPGHPDTLDGLGELAESLVALGRGAEAVPLIDECVAGAAGKAVNPRLVPGVMALRLGHFRQANDPAGCRATAALWEGLNRPDADSLYAAARFRAVAAGLYAKAGQPAEAAADADRAMGWLTKAVAAGYRDRAHMAKDADLDPLRGRADFRAVLASLPEPAPPPRPVQ